MADFNDQYFEYLKGRSRLGGWYRNHLLYPRLARRLAGRALDIGCGIGDMLASRAHTVGVDINPKTVAYCTSLGLEAHVMDVDVLPFEASAFDSVLLDNVLEHIENPAPLLQEARRVLVPGGRLLVGVPGERGWDSDLDHKVRYDEESLSSTLRASGFQHSEFFYAPLFKSRWLSQRLRQYCLYAVFTSAP